MFSECLKSIKQNNKKTINLSCNTLNEENKIRLEIKTVNKLAMAEILEILKTTK